MPLRLLRYVVRIWERWQHGRTSDKIPLVLPVLLHHGPTGWSAAPELAAMIDASAELVEARRPFVPHFRFLLDDLEALSLEELATRAASAQLRLVQLALWSRSYARLRAAARDMHEIVAAFPRDEPTRTLLAQLYVYLLRAAQPDVDARDIRTILLEIAGPEGKEDVVNAADQLIAQGRAEGEARGRAEGLELARKALLVALEARSIPLSDVARARVAACDDVALLTRWLERAATVAAEAEIFA